ncbi:MAG: disulfide bond formation protein B [Desulfobacteraceae bacterium]|nr:disulfide bond formation protein B [Desulfobacteraceae bacterium]
MKGLLALLALCFIATAAFAQYHQGVESHPFSLSSTSCTDNAIMVSDGTGATLGSCSNVVVNDDGTITQPDDADIVERTFYGYLYAANGFGISTTEWVGFGHGSGYNSFQPHSMALQGEGGVIIEPPGRDWYLKSFGVLAHRAHLNGNDEECILAIVDRPNDGVVPAQGAGAIKALVISAIGVGDSMPSFITYDGGWNTTSTVAQCDGPAGGSIATGTDVRLDNRGEYCEIGHGTPVAFTEGGGIAAVLIDPDSTEGPLDEDSGDCTVENCSCDEFTSGFFWVTISDRAEDL